MNFPKIKFRPMTLEENIEIIKWAFYEESGDVSVHYYTIQYFPELALIDPNKSKDEVYKLIEKIVTKNYIKNKEIIDNEVKRYNNLWNKYNDKYFKILTDFLGVGFPKNIKQINALVGLTPVCPRNLDDFSFSVSTNIDDLELIDKAAHETLHFLWFEKWKIMYPKTPRKHFNPPYIEWKYSEMVTDPILNNKPFKELFNFTERGYDVFYELYDNDELVMDKLRNIYSGLDSIENKIEKGFTYIIDYLKRTSVKKIK